MRIAGFSKDSGMEILYYDKEYIGSGGIGSYEL